LRGENPVVAGRRIASYANSRQQRNRPTGVSKRFAALPKADNLMLGELKFGAHAATILLLLGVKMGKPEMKGPSEQVLLFRVPAKAQEALAKRVNDSTALAEEWTARARALEPDSRLTVTAGAARELASLAARALSLDAWVWAVVGAGNRTVIGAESQVGGGVHQIFP
jgi:hypothetical protein